MVEIFVIELEVEQMQGRI